MFFSSEQFVRHMSSLTSQLTVIVLKREHVRSAIIFVSYDNHLNTRWCFHMNQFFPFQAEPVQIIFKNSVPTSKKTQHFIITQISWLTLFEEIIAVCTNNHTKLEKKSTVIDFQSMWYMYRMSHLSWNPPRQHATAAVSKLSGNELVTAQNIAVAC
jgi:hypothetical protein